MVAAEDGNLFADKDIHFGKLQDYMSDKASEEEGEGEPNKGRNARKARRQTTARMVTRATLRSSHR